jgi:hypothetical protein
MWTDRRGIEHGGTSPGEFFENMFPDPVKREEVRQKMIQHLKEYDRYVYERITGNYRAPSIWKSDELFFGLEQEKRGGE